MEIEVVEDKFYIVDKPKSWTSFDVVKKLKNLGGFKKIGHAGTLDPLATGVLILCVGKYTKKIEFFQNLPKIYSGSFVLGKTTPSVDLETDFNAEFPVNHIKNESLIEVANSFLGNIKQLPPIYSAIKLNGERLYKHARKGVAESELEIKYRDVFVDRFDINAELFPEIYFNIKCSKGTYIRSIVRDFGLKLNSGAYLKSLCREAIGEYSLDQSQSIIDFSADQYELLL